VRTIAAREVPARAAPGRARDRPARRPRRDAGSAGFKGLRPRRHIGRVRATSGLTLIESIKIIFLARLLKKGRALAFIHWMGTRRPFKFCCTSECNLPNKKPHSLLSSYTVYFRRPRSPPVAKQSCCTTAHCLQQICDVGRAFLYCACSRSLTVYLIRHAAILSKPVFEFFVTL
jgi:hypothetical protein